MNFWIELKTWFAIKLDIRHPQDLTRCIELSFAKGIAEATVRAQRFLLEQAPMIQPEHVGRAGVAYAYVNPQTWTKHTSTSVPTPPWTRFGKGTTLWVITDLMPEDRVIYSPNCMPGVTP